jgi:hypothetical protein
MDQGAPSARGAARACGLRPFTAAPALGGPHESQEHLPPAGPHDCGMTGPIRPALWSADGKTSGRLEPHRGRGHRFASIAAWQLQRLGCSDEPRSSGQINESPGSERIRPSSRVGHATCWPGRAGISIPIRGSPWRRCTWVTSNIRFTCTPGGARGRSMRRVGTLSPNSCRSTATSRVSPSVRWRRSEVTFGSSVKSTCIDNRTSTGQIRQNAHAPMWADTTRPGSRRFARSGGWSRVGMSVMRSSASRLRSSASGVQDPSGCADSCAGVYSTSSGGTLATWSGRHEEAHSGPSACMPRSL